MKREPISFVIPAFNSATTIEASIRSIFEGNFLARDEVIVVNDASIDHTKDVLANLKKTFPQLVVITNKKNKGCPASRNIGIRKAKSKYIFNLDSDNILAPKSIDQLFLFLKQNNADIAAFSQLHFFVQDPKKVTHIWDCVPGKLSLADFLSGHINPGPAGNYLYTKKSWRKIGGYWEYGKGLHEAWGFSLKQLANGAQFYVMPNSLYYHRYGHESLFISENKKDPGSLIANKMISHYLDLFTKLEQQYILAQDSNWFDNLEKRPLHLKGKAVGKTGKVLYTSPFHLVNRFIGQMKSVLKF